MKHSKYVGLDVHQEQITIAVADEGRDGEVRQFGVITNDLRAIRRQLERLSGADTVLHIVYEAGPTGFALCRELRRLHLDCIIVAPSKTPKKASYQKTDRRDAMTLARLHRAGELTAIYIPDEADEAIRDLTRARADAVHDLTRAKQHVKSFLLRQGYKYPGKASWSEAHRRYLRDLEIPNAHQKCVLEEYMNALREAEERVARIDGLLEIAVLSWRMYPAIQALMCMRGIKTVAAAVLVSEIGEIRRFRHPRHLMAYLGLVPQENTSDQTRRMGSITKAGNPHVRWILLEIIQHAFLPPRISVDLSHRQEGQSTKYIELAWKAQNRLYKRARQLLQRNKMKAKIQVALAREMAGFVWAILSEVPHPAA